MAPFLGLFPELTKEKKKHQGWNKASLTILTLQYMLNICIVILNRKTHFLYKSRKNEEQNIRSVYNNKVKLE